MLDPKAAATTDADRALCDFAAKLTRTPGNMSSGDVEALVRHGFSEEAITMAVQVIAYFNYINRIAEGLGVDPDPWMSLEREQWLARRGCYPQVSDAAQSAASSG